ncbi:MAG: carbonic anhydrase family protein, partial [Rhodocyclaceae bacterium]|nr:carbonic anhydrase family protein [Rhodocyclaceae bacterium]
MRHIFIACLLATAGLAAQAAEWVEVAAERGKTIEIDRASVLRAEAGKLVAWGRLTLPEAEAEKAGYTAVQALNRYDCQYLRFVTLKRVYFDADMNIVREERLPGDHEIALLPGTLDDKLFREVCKPPSTKSLHQVADQAEKAGARAAASAGAKPIAETRRVPSARLVAESGHGEEAKARPEARGAVEHKAEPKPATESKAAAEAQAQPEHKSIVPPLPGLPQKPAREARQEARDEIPLPRPAPPPPRRAQLAHAAPRAAAVQAAAEPAVPPPHAHDVHWTYEGETGPANWANLKPEWSRCGAGKRQSPIDIRDGIRVDLTPIKFDYKSSYVAIVDNGHTIQVNVGGGSTISVAGQSYELLQ